MLSTDIFCSQGWPRNKVERISQLCVRRDFPSDTYVFRQGDEPDFVYFVFEGELKIIKEVSIVVKNRFDSVSK